MFEILKHPFLSHAVVAIVSAVSAAWSAVKLKAASLEAKIRAELAGIRKQL